MASTAIGAAIGVLFFFIILTLGGYLGYSFWKSRREGRPFRPFNFAFFRRSSYAARSHTPHHHNFSALDVDEAWDARVGEEYGLAHRDEEMELDNAEMAGRYEEFANTGAGKKAQNPFSDEAEDADGRPKHSRNESGGSKFTEDM
ncbi:hypothetical protein SAICODRAFT_4691 [Saitoella complicata NRRL Y-17804]|nr:uncharacterized protein SAICODRAFT_4691 [Saitoella complicata NRRL Y-17804]ODQ56511.1 hypothetical protein SAICODRAFT_4691 [Saitoella complicata NRRL Y-17804]